MLTLDPERGAVEGEDSGEQIDLSDYAAEK